MDEKGLRTGHFVALAGALALVGSLFRPWYSIEIPQQLRDALGGAGGVGNDPGLLGQMARGLAAALPKSISASGWRELQGADVAICVVALLGVALVLGAAGVFGAAVRVDRGAAAQGVAGAGAIGLAIALVHALRPPGGTAAADYVHVAEGVWIAVAGGAAMVIGGFRAAAAPPTGFATATPAASFPRLDPELPPVFAAPAPGGRPTSVPPPAPGA